ncbi:MAG: hypothetical protein KME29_33535 [Calothrix sp. FI2-JRJ7]|jgi:hypothetical protein|nr:hypothetical protein [Calothrix sp. FI2-JRJ7]
MGVATKYWKLVKINGAGEVITKDITTAQIFFVRVFGVSDDVIDDDVQRQLLQLYGNGVKGAELCLRCFISWIIVQVCQNLAIKFGTQHNLSCSDLLPYVLDDNENKSSLVNDYSPFSLQILQSYNSQRGSLTTWVTMKVKQHPQLNKFLLECGLYLVSDWAILNDTRPTQLERILKDFHNCTDIEIKQAQSLLLCYHQVYHSQHLQYIQTGGRLCKAPTLEQLLDIGRRLQNKTGTIINSQTVLTQLQKLATQLREYRIYIRCRVLPTKSLNIQSCENSYSPTDNIAAPLRDDDENEQIEFLQYYEEQFPICLQRALAIVTEDKVQQLRRKKNNTSEKFIIALELLHCQNMSMKDIALRLGMRAQDAVTRLLKLKNFRNDVKREMLAILKQSVTAKANIYIDTEQIQAIDEELNNILCTQINTVIENAELELHNVKNSKNTSVFAEELCKYLDSRNNNV